MEFVHPIRDNEQVHEIERRLYERRGDSDKAWRQYMLFELGIYTGLRISDLARLRVEDVRGREVLTMREQKTGKKTDLPLSRKIQRIARQELKNLRANGISFFRLTSQNRRRSTRNAARASSNRSGERRLITTSTISREKSGSTFKSVATR